MFVDFNILNQLGSPAINSNTFANRPAAGQTGRLFVSIDTFEIYRDNGTTWDLIGGPGSSTITGTGTATQVAYFTSSQAIGSSANLFWDNANTRLGIGTATPGVALDVHSTGIMAHFNTTSATGNSYLAFQRTGTNVWRLGDQYNAGANFFQIHNTALSNNAVQIDAATNKTTWQAVQTYTTGLARANYFDYNLSVAAGGSFSSPNAITALGASLDLTLAGSATIPSGARSGLDAYNSIGFTGAGTLTHNQGAQIRAYSNVTAGWAFNGSATGTVTHLAGLRALFPDNTGSAINVTNNYALLLNDQTPNTGTVTYTNRWGVYQEGASDLNYFAANMLIGTTVNAGYKLDVNGNAHIGTGDSRLIIGDVSSANTESVIWLRTGSGKYAYSIAAQSLADESLTIARSTTQGGTTFLTPSLTLNSSGNLGLSVTPSAWRNINKVLQVNSSVLYNESNANTWLGHNYYEDSGGNYRYINSDYATAFRQVNGMFIFYNAPSGTAGNTFAFTGRMTLDANGNLGIGTGTPAEKLEISGTGNIYTSVVSTSGADAGIKFNSLANRNFGILCDGNLRFYDFTSSNDRARIVGSNGNFLIGTTTDGGAKLAVNGATSINTTTNGTYSKLIVAGAIHCNNNTTAATTNQNSYGNFYANQSTVTGGAGATTIYSAAGSEGSLYVVSGLETVGGKRFVDLVLVLGAVTTAPVVVSSQNYAGPATRTYTNTGETIKLELSGIDSYNVFVTGMGSNEKT